MMVDMVYDRVDQFGGKKENIMFYPCHNLFVKGLWINNVFMSYMLLCLDIDDRSTLGIG